MGKYNVHVIFGIFKSTNVSNYRNVGSKIIEFIPLNGNNTKIINIYWTGGHYEPIKT